jgi:hypothetical protein
MSGSPATGNTSTSLQTGVGNDYQLMGTDMNTPLKQQQSEGHGRGHHPRLSLGNVIVAEDEPAVGQFSFMVALAFCCNYCMGTGFLTLPWAFAQVGEYSPVPSLSSVRVSFQVVPPSVHA